MQLAVYQKYNEQDRWLKLCARQKNNRIRFAGRMDRIRKLGVQVLFSFILPILPAKRILLFFSQMAQFLWCIEWFKEEAVKGYNQKISKLSF